MRPAPRTLRGVPAGFCAALHLPEQMRAPLTGSVSLRDFS
jgi:hypothetical protein